MKGLGISKTSVFILHIGLHMVQNDFILKLIIHYEITEGGN